MDDDTDRAEAARRGSPYLNARQAAFFLKMSARTLQRLRARGNGPTPRRHAAARAAEGWRLWSRTECR